ncbi:MAG: metal-dependent transcriptional regulator [Lishizhenia sp.]
MLELSQSEENYIKAIYGLCEENNDAVSTNILAENLQTKASSVTDMVKKLSEKKLVSYKKYKGCSLTSLGEKAALKVIRKHRLWEVFLVDKLDFGWDEVHDIAEQLEHIRSIKLTDQLDAFLDYPKYDPHGDPIPDKEGNFAKRGKSALLNELKVDDVAKVIGVSDGSASFLQYLDQQKIQLGTEVKLLSSFEFDGSISILVNNRELSLSKIASVKICVEKI